MDSSTKPEVSPGLVSGRLEGISVPDLMWALCRRRRTGVLNLSHGSVQKSIYIQDGRIVFASSSDPDDRLGELLLRIGMVRLEQLDEVLGRLDSGKRLGTLLVEAGHLEPEQLVEGVLNQIQEIVLGLFTWEQGEYRFEESELPTQEVITLGMRTPEILMQGIRRIRSFVRIRRSVGPLRTVFRRTENWEDALHGLELNEGEKLLVARLQDNSSIQELCDEVFLSNFEIYQTLWALKVLGVISEVEASASTAKGASLEGLLDAEGIAPIMVRLCRSRETGVLYVSSGSRERTFHIREGNCVFATSNDIEDGLVAYLLRRGVISLQDREETAKRLLSNKRVGAILRQLGVIEEDELQDLVREQLSEIVFDTFHWQTGDYTFVSGELPTVEEITLALSLESLVAAGQRRITSWTRIREGCGGLDRPLTLTKDYLEVLDRMSVGTEEWEVVSFLRQPTTPRDICIQSRLEDFRVCQVLWTLRTLGAVEQADPAAVAVGAPADAASVSEDAVAAQEPLEAQPAEADSEPQVAEPVAGEAEPVEAEPVEVQAESVEVDADSVETAAEPLEAADAAEAEPLAIEETQDEIEEEVAAEPLVEAAEEAVEPEIHAEPEAADEAFEAEGVEAEGVETEGVEYSWKVDAMDPEEPADEPAEEIEAADSEDSQGVEAAIEERPDSAEAVEAATGQADESSDEAEEPEPVDPAEQAIIDGLKALPGVPSGDSTTYIPREAVEAALQGRASGEAEDAEDAVEDGAAGEGQESAQTMEAAAESVEAEEASVEAGSEFEDNYDTALDDLIGAPVAEAEAAYAEEAADQLAEEYAEESTEVSAEAAAAEEAHADVAGSNGDVPKDSTSEIPRAEVEAALEEEPALPAFEPPEDLDFHIARLNARQKIVYRIIRTEVGAGAVNFVRSCATRLEADPFAGAEMRADGSWDAASLRQVVIEQRVEDPARQYGRLIEIEIDTLRDHIGEARASSLRRQVERVDTSVALENGRGMNTSRL